jgi:hypothetical protein
MSMPTATPTSTRPDAPAVPLGLDAVRTFTQLGRDLLALSVSSAEEVLRLSGETQEAAVEKFRVAFGSSVFPAVSLDVWKWWQGVGVGVLSSYADMMTRTPTTGAGVPVTVSTEVDLTDPRPDRAQPARRAAAAETGSARVTAPARRKTEA